MGWQDATMSYSEFLDNDGLTVNHMATLLPMYPLFPHCLAELTGFPPNVRPDRNSDNSDDGENHKGEPEAQDEQDSAGDEGNGFVEQSGFCGQGHDPKRLAYRGFQHLISMASTVCPAS
jgi:hypothetical protein